MKFLHSYNYVNSKFIVQDNNLVDKNNNLLLKIINIPELNDIYSIKVEKILQKKIFSKKKNKSYYTKHNIKIYLIIDFNNLYYKISNNIKITNQNLLFKIILSNQILINDNLIENMCINKSFSKKIDLINKNYFNDSFNYLNVNKLFINLNKQEINLKSNYKHFSLNGGFFYYDILYLFLNDILNNLIDNNLINETLLVVDNTIKHYFDKKFNIYNINESSKKINKKYKIILAFTYFNKSKFNYDYLWICKNNINTNDILKNLELYFNIKLYDYILNNKLLFQLQNLINFKYYKELLLKQKTLKINYIKFNKNNTNYNYKIIDKLNDTQCCICFTNKNNVVTECNHLFCSECINKLFGTTFNCPLCRAKLNKNMVYKILELHNLDETLKFIINKKSLKNKTIICKKNETHKLKSILDHFSINNINLINSNNLNTLNNIINNSINIFVFNENKIIDILNNIKKFKKLNIFVLTNNIKYNMS